MKALTFHGKHQIQYEDYPDPRMESPDDVIVKVKLCAICGSDLHVYHETEKGLDDGTAMGHEFMGEVVEVGKDVRSFRNGDRVASPFSVSCGRCYFCGIGLTSRCVSSQLFGWVEKGKGLSGGQAQYVRVPMADSTLLKVPEGISDDDALLLGDIMPTGFFCARQALIKPKETHAVIGCGPVGLMAIIGAIEFGSEHVYAIDVVEERLEAARKLGAIPVNCAKWNAAAWIREVTDGRGADAVMEAVGSHAASRLAYDIVRPGGIISVVGVCNDLQMPFSPAEAYNKNLTFKVGRCPARFMMDKLVPVIQSAKYDYGSLITHRLSLSEGAFGYDIFAGKKDNCLKVVLSP